MEILMLLLLYCLSQNSDFAQSVKPIMEQLKDSEQMLRFLNDLSSFSKTFSTFADKTDTQPQNATCDTANDKEKNPQSSATKGIADSFIQTVLESYLKNRNN